MANAKLDELKKRRDDLKRQVKHASDNRDKQKKSDRRRKRKKENSFSQLVPVFIAVLVVLIWCTMQDVLWGGAIELAAVSQDQPNSAQSRFVAQYLSAKGTATVKEDERIELTITANDQQLLGLFQNDIIQADERKAYGMLACYKAMTEAGYSPEQAIPLLACAKHEGKPGLVQYTYPKANKITSDAASKGIHVSDQRSNPLYIDSGTKARALLSIQSDSDGMGIGTAQWTNGRCRVYLELLLELYGDANYTAAMLYEADCEMYRRELASSSYDMLETVQGMAGDLEAMQCYMTAKYEAGYGYYLAVKKDGGDPNKIQSWRDHPGSSKSDQIVRGLAESIQKRYDTALLLQQEFSKLATQAQTS